MFARRFITRSFSSIQSENRNALGLFQQSCYKKVDFKISEDSSVSEVLRRFSALNIGCLAVTKSDKNSVVGVVSKRDYINKVASLEKSHTGLLVKDICTFSPNIIVAKTTDSLDTCMNKMLFKDIRHLLIVDEMNPNFVGMLSIKDLIREITKGHKETITRLSDFGMGKGAFFGSE
jgi:CBS domain-containing protein